MDYKQLSSSLTKYRGNWETFWQEVAERCFTDHADFNVTNSPGTRRAQRVFDSTTSLAVSRSASAIGGLITPKSEQWHSLSTDDHELNKSQNVKRYFEEVTNILFAHRYAARAGFAMANHQSLRSLMGFGTGIMTINESKSGRGIVYQPLFLGDMYIGVNNFGQVDTVQRDFEYTRKQAIQEWGEDKVPKKVMDDKNDTKFKFCHIVHPNEDYNMRSIRADERKYKYVYMFKEDMKTPIDEGGYYSFPYAICREVTSPNEIYGRSPAMQILPEIKGLNEMRKTNIMASQLAVTPPLLAPSVGVSGVGGLGAGPMAVNFKPAGVTHGGVSAQGQQMVIPMNTGVRPDIGQQSIEESRKVVNDSFFLNLFQILVETPTMTATEVLARTQEKGILLAPTADRLEAEYLGVMIDRELDILSRQGLLPEIPTELIEAGGDYTVMYNSPITRSQKAGQTIGIQETFSMALNAASVDPTILDVINLDDMLRKVAEVNGTPPTSVRSDAEVEEIRKGKEQAQETQALLEQAPVLAGAAKDLAQSQALGA